MKLQGKVGFVQSTARRMPAQALGIICQWSTVQKYCLGVVDTGILHSGQFANPSVPVECGYLYPGR